MSNAELRGGFLESLKTSKAVRFIGLGGAGILLASCGTSTVVEGDVQQLGNSPSLSGGVDPSKESPANSYLDTSTNLTKFTSVAEVESILANNTIANDNILTLTPLLNAANGDYEDLKNANVDTDEIIANYQVNQYFLNEIANLRTELPNETGPSGYLNPELLNLTLEEIEASQFLLAKVIENLKESGTVLESSNECPAGNSEDQTPLSSGPYTSKTQPPLGLFGISKESTSCNVPSDIFYATSNAMQDVFKMAIQSLTEYNKPASAKIFAIMNDVITVKDPEVQKIAQEYLA